MLTPDEVRELCTADDPKSTVDFLEGRVGAPELRTLLGLRTTREHTRRSGMVELTDETGRTTDMAVHVPSGENRRLGALIVLHGAGGSGEQVLPHFAALGDRLGMAVLCPTAQTPPQAGRNNMDLAGIFGKRFAQTSWDLRGRDFPVAALRWARRELGADPDRCVLTGVSMGGLATWNLAMRFWHLFAAVVPINGALSIWESFGVDRRARALLPNMLPLPSFVIHGGADEQIPAEFDRESVATLRGLEHSCLEHVEVEDGGHALETLRMGEGTPLFHRLEHWLGSRRRLGRPVEVRHRADEEAHGRAHWVSVSGIRPHQSAQVWARHLTPNRIDLHVEGADRVQIHLTSDAIAPGDVDVSVNGVPSRIRFEPDVATVVKSYRDTADPELVAEQVVSLSVPRTAHPPVTTEARDDATHPV